MRMQVQERSHRLEKIIAVIALVGVLALTIGFAEAAEPKKTAKKSEEVFLRSAVVLVQDAASGETLLAKNQSAVLPIASITKLMTAVVMLDAGLNMEQRVAISDEDTDFVKGTRSRLRPGTVLTRQELLLLALMSSENRAAHSLGRTYPGGTDAFVKAMNAKAAKLGMADSRFVDPTGLSPQNVSSASDLARLVSAAHEYPLIRQYSTRESATVQALGRELGFRNTNGLVRSAQWDIGLSKTGFINEAGRCLVMRVKMASRDVIVVLLDSWGKFSRVGDANRIKKWLETNGAGRRV
jgi:serine-type D-Ala-D-Ala endopeptidase (penicillin-binding protein 7)